MLHLHLERPGICWDIFPPSWLKLETISILSTLILMKIFWSTKFKLKLGITLKNYSLHKNHTSSVPSISIRPNFCKFGVFFNNSYLFCFQNDKMICFWASKICSCASTHSVCFVDKKVLPKQWLGRYLQYAESVTGIRIQSLSHRMYSLLLNVVLAGKLVNIVQYKLTQKWVSGHSAHWHVTQLNFPKEAVATATE